MRKRLVEFSGLNDVVRTDLLKDSELQKMVNYEIINDGYLHKRSKLVDYKSLGDKIRDEFRTISQISEPYYPIKKPSGMTNSFMLAIYGQKTEYKTKLFYRGVENEKTVWLVNDLDTLNGNDTESSIIDPIVTYTKDSDVRFSVGEYGIVITDGVNRAHRVFVDSEGDINAEVLGIPAPPTKITFDEIDPEESNNWEEDYKVDSMEVIGLVQTCYTVVTKSGEESNPSPISETHDMQYFKYTVYDDETGEGGDETRWIAKVGINNLTIPSVSTSLEDRIKYFKVYYRVFRYSAGNTPQPFQFGQRFEVADKDSTNKYTLTNTLSLGEYVDSEKDIAPIANWSVQNAGVCMLGNCKLQAKFPYDFDNYEKITVTNNDSSTYVDAIVRIRLYDKTADAEYDPITNFEVTTTMLSNSHKYRLYDTDLITPLNVIADITDGSYVDVWVKIPQLSSGETHSIYFCFDGEGVTDATQQTYSNGKWYDADNPVRYGDFAKSVLEQEVFKSEVRVTNSTTIAAEPAGINKADENNRSNLYYKLKVLSKDLKKNRSITNLLFNDKINIGNSYLHEPGKTTPKLKYDSGNVFKKGYFSMSLSFAGSWAMFETGGNKIDKMIIDLPNNSLYISYNSDDSKWYYALKNGISKTFIYFDSIPYIEDKSYKIFLLYSWDLDDNKGSLYIGDMKTGDIDMQEIDTLEYEVDEYNKYIIGTFYPIQYSDIAQIKIVEGDYLSTNKNADVDAVYNIANFMPATSDTIGYSYSETTHNNNISFETITEDFDVQTYNDMLKWNNLRYLNYADLNYKRIGEEVLLGIAAPSFLKERYDNTNIIFTRNGVYRFILQGTPDGWADATDSIVEEFKNYGLYAKNSLAKGGNALYWLSESGVIKWDSTGIRLISQNRVNTDSLDENAVGFYCPVRQQYIIG